MGCASSSAPVAVAPLGARLQVSKVDDMFDLQPCDTFEAAPLEVPQPPEEPCKPSAVQAAGIKVGDTVVVVSGRYRGQKGTVAHERLNKAETRRFFTIEGLYSIELTLFWFDEHQLCVAAPEEAKKAADDASTAPSTADAQSNASDLATQITEL